MNVCLGRVLPPHHPLLRRDLVPPQLALVRHSKADQHDQFLDLDQMNSTVIFDLIKLVHLVTTIGMGKVRMKMPHNAQAPHTA